MKQDSDTQEYNPVALGTDYATTDPAYYDPDFPPIHFPHVFLSKGKPIQSFMWLANGRKAKGCVIISPQRYGGDCLDSLIPALVGAGINVLRFNPRGMWDKEEDYSFMSAVEDLHSAVAFLRQNSGRHATPPGTTFHPRTFLIDTDRIAVLGKSGGGGMVGWIAAAENPALNTVIPVSPNGLLSLPLPEEYSKVFVDLKESTAGRIDLHAELEAVSPADYDRFDMHKVASKLIDKNVLLIGHSDSEHVKNIHQPLIDTMQNVGAKHFSQAILGADEYFLTARIALARLIVSWLKVECRF
ncbi:hypothetical protein DPV78_011797 [Talaromyces pinophilus]|nr:hypothetical protein DPV78_011797 [Talaromyces pinophilus]